MRLDVCLDATYDIFGDIFTIILQNPIYQTLYTKQVYKT